jgi:hypothetical protein
MNPAYGPTSSSSYVAGEAGLPREPPPSIVHVWVAFGSERLGDGRNESGLRLHIV